MPDRIDVDLVVTGAAELLTCAGDAADLVGRLPGAGVAVSGERIVAVGDVSGYRGRREVDARGGVVMPGFVDAHTHLVFGADRVEEYAARVGGTAVPPGAPRGIQGTVRETRRADRAELTRTAAARIASMIDSGTTTVEVKTGYGLDDMHELRMLEVTRDLARMLPIDVVSTYLGAHAYPPEGHPDRYVDSIVRRIPALGGLADACDVYCDDGYYTLADTARIFAASRAAGLPVKLHLDAYGPTGAASLAIEYGAISVDHLNHTTDAELRRLAAAGIPGVYLPCLEYAVGHPAPFDPRRALDAGMELALATDLCPGCFATNMQLVIAMACRTGGLTPAQAVRAATHGSARALGRADWVGSLLPGMQADLVVLDIPRYEHLAYRIGANSAAVVIARGAVVAEAEVAA